MLVVVSSWLACNSTPAPPAAEVAPAAAPAPAAVDAYVVGQSTLRKTASDDRKIADPNGGTEQVNNWVASLHRAEKVTILGEDGDWSRVALSDDTEGWIKTNRLARAPDGGEIKVGTLLADGKVFVRPDMTAIDTDKAVPAGSVVFVLQKKDPFVEVDYPRTSISNARGWALASEVTFDPIEVEAAKLIMKVRELRTQKDESAAKVEELARTQFAASKLLPLLDAPMPEPAPPAGAPPAGSAPPAPATPPQP